MADYYTQYASALFYDSDEQEQWLKNVLMLCTVDEPPSDDEREDLSELERSQHQLFAKHFKDGEPLTPEGKAAYQARDSAGGCTVDLNYFFGHDQDTGKRYVNFTSFESGDIDALLIVVHHFLKHFNIKDPWTLEWAFTCSAHRVDGFGGGAAMVTHRGFECMNTGTWLQEKRAAYDDKRDPTKV